MLRTSLALAGLLLLAPATAFAAPFGELPFQSVNGPAACLQATGAPGELVRQSEATAQFLTAGPTGLTAGGTLPTDGSLGCADVAAWPGGGGLLTFPVGSSIDDEVWVRGFLREPGQGWGEAIDILPPETRVAGASFAVAASERGDALVAASSVDAAGRLRVRVARRLPGAAFGAPERLTSARSGTEDSLEVRAAYSASGEAVVTWDVPGPKPGDPVTLRAAIAPPGAPFGAPQNIARAERSMPSALAVGADGRALAVFTTGKRLFVAERAPGGAFGPPSQVGEPAGEVGTFPAAVVRPDGGALVAWWSPLDAGLTVRARERAGAFGPPVAVARAQRLDPVATMVQQRFSALSSGEEAGRPHATLTADGRVLLTWSDLAERQGVWRVVPGVALVNFSGGGLETDALGGAVRNADLETPVLLADGSPAVAWTDSGPDGTLARVHLARQGTPDAPEPAAPTVKLTAPRSRTLKLEQPLTVKVACDAACDVYAHIAGQEASAVSVSLSAAGSRRLVFQPIDGPIAPRGGGKVRILVRSSAPGAHRATARTLTLDLRRAKTKFPPRVLGLTVTRDGDDLLVRWRTATPARPRGYSAWAFDDAGDPINSDTPTGSARRTSFEVRIRDARGASTVTVYASAENADKVRRTTVKVPG